MEFEGKRLGQAGFIVVNVSRPGRDGIFAG